MAYFCLRKLTIIDIKIDMNCRKIQSFALRACFRVKTFRVSEFHALGACFRVQGIVGVSSGYLQGVVSGRMADWA
jgi:hypothetical protein